MPRSARKIIMWVLVTQVAWTLPVAVYMGYRWRTTDEVDHSYPCRRGTCYSGPTTYLTLMLVAGGVTLVLLTVALLLSIRWRRQAAERDRLLADGLRLPAVLVEVAITIMRINGRRLYRMTFESLALDPPIQVVERSTSPLAIGLRATIAYDPTNPAGATLVEDIEKLASPVYLHQKRWRETRP